MTYLGFACSYLGVQYVNGSLENSYRNNEAGLPTLKIMGIREHVCDILEGGEEAFLKKVSMDLQEYK